MSDLLIISKSSFSNKFHLFNFCEYIEFNFVNINQINKCNPHRLLIITNVNEKLGFQSVSDIHELFINLLLNLKPVLEDYQNFQTGYESVHGLTTKPMTRRI